jgi:hypothetical protein
VTVWQLERCCGSSGVHLARHAALLSAGLNGPDVRFGRYVCDVHAEMGQVPVQLAKFHWHSTWDAAVWLSGQYATCFRRRGDPIGERAFTMFSRSRL